MKQQEEEAMRVARSLEEEEDANEKRRHEREERKLAKARLAKQAKGRPAADSKQTNGDHGERRPPATKRSSPAKREEDPNPPVEEQEVHEVSEFPAEPESRALLDNDDAGFELAPDKRRDRLKKKKAHY